MDMIAYIEHRRIVLPLKMKLIPPTRNPKQQGSTIPRYIYIRPKTEYRYVWNPNKYQRPSSTTMKIT